MNEESLLQRISTDPGVMLGKPTIRGTRLTVEIIVEKFAYGESIDDLKQDYPFLEDDDIRAALLYAARCVAHEDLVDTHV